MTHFTFINAYLLSKGAYPVDLGQFRTLPSSQATRAQQIGRLTNLMQLTVDTSYWTWYRSPDKNPDLDPNFTFPQATPGLFSGKVPAIPRTMPTSTFATTFKRSLTRRDFTPGLSSKVAPASLSLTYQNKVSVI